MVKELAAGLPQKPFRIIADLLEFGHFASADDAVDFDTAARIAMWIGVSIFLLRAPPEGAQIEIALIDSQGRMVESQMSDGFAFATD